MTDDQISKLLVRLSELEKEFRTHALASLNHASEVKEALQKEIAAERLAVAKMNQKLDTMAHTLLGIQNARLIQQGFTSLVLAGFIIVLIKVLGG